MDELQTLKAREAELEKKIEDYNKFLVEKWDSPNRLQVISDRNAASVDLKTVRFCIENKMAGKPLLGYEIEDITPTIQGSETKKNKQL